MGITVKNNKTVTKNMTIKGDDGVGIKTITSGTPVITEEKTTTPITVTLTDETTQNFNVEAQNGSGGDNVLTKPTTTPSTTQLVAVDNTNTQTMLNIGDGLSVENGSLKASGGSGGKLYHKFASFRVSNHLESVNNIIIDYYSSTSLIPSSYEEIKTDIMGTSLMGDTPNHCSVAFALSPTNTKFLYIPNYFVVGITLGIKVFYQKLDISSGTPVITTPSNITLTESMFSSSLIKVEEV